MSAEYTGNWQEADSFRYRVPIERWNLDDLLVVSQQVLGNHATPRQEYETRLQVPHLLCHAIDGQNTMGYAVAYQQDPSTAYVWQILALQQYRDVGVLGSLLQYSMNWAKECGFQHIQARCRRDQDKRHSFLSHHGFSCVSHIPGRVRREDKLIFTRLVA